MRKTPINTTNYLKMQTEAIFERIADRIQMEISKARSSILIAVAWFTNANIFDELVKKANLGCTISLIISDDIINQKCAIDFERLNVNKSCVYKIGNGETELMHNKFCVIDSSVVITGSYNWSYKAEKNFENVIITYNDTFLAEQFVFEFHRIRKIYFPNIKQIEAELPLPNLIKRLEIIKNYIFLGDIQEVNNVCMKISEYDLYDDVIEILLDLKKQEFSLAVIKIDRFISKFEQVQIWSDTELAALKLEIINLENKVNAFSNEKIELEKLLAEFQHRHTSELGQLILEILELRKVIFKYDKDKFEEAQNDEKQYKEQFEAEKNKEIFELTGEQKSELKRLFRKASFLCHPDKVGSENKHIAQQMFVELKNAYDINDMNRVTEICKDLEKGYYFVPNSETISEKELLKFEIGKLKMSSLKLEKEIIEIKQSNAFKTVSEISDWDAYFSITRKDLEKEFNFMKNELI
jgi:hypothetical protein